MEYTVREFQLKELEIAVAMHKVLTDAGIPYYLIGGCCIGALRHQGFIPWDDDMDIGIPRRFFEAAEQALAELPEGMYYDPIEHHKIQDAPIGHVYIDDGSAMDEAPRVDVFVLDNVPRNAQLRKKQKFWQRVYHVCILRRPSENRGKLLHLMTKAICSLPAPILNLFQKKAYQELVKYQYENTGLTGNLYGVVEDREIVPSDYFGKARMVPFEDTYLPIPEKSEEYMTHIYGDYMQLPPEEDRKPKHFHIE